MEETMRRFLMILGTLGAALALPAPGDAAQWTVTSPDSPAAVEREWVDASELVDLLAEKGLITPREQAALRRSTDEPLVDPATMDEIFRTESYRGDA
jgi:hypothetical protein